MSEIDKDCWKCHWCWLGRCVNTNAHYGRDVSVKNNQVKDCPEYITKEEWNKTHTPPMNHNRCMELLNAMIDNLHVAESNMTVIKYLLHIGFTEEELVTYFGYYEPEVKEAAEDMEEYSGGIVLT